VQAMLPEGFPFHQFNVNLKVNRSREHVTTIWFYFSFANREKIIYRVSDINLLHKHLS